MAPQCPGCGGKSQVVVDGMCVRNHDGDDIGFLRGARNTIPALYFYRRGDVRKTVTKPDGETVTTDGYGKVIE